MNADGKFNYQEWKKYKNKIYILLRGDLPEWEKDFLTSLDKCIGNGMSEKQKFYLDKIIFKYFPTHTR
jgi:hypothetical protein